MLLITFRGNNVNEIPIGPYESNVMNINHGQSVEWLHTDKQKPTDDVNELLRMKFIHNSRFCSHILFDCTAASMTILIVTDKNSTILQAKWKHKTNWMHTTTTNKDQRTEFSWVNGISCLSSF